MNAQLITAENIVPISHDEQVVLQPLSLSVKPGKLICLLGPNGVGKTSYLRTLAGIDLPKNGELTLLGEDAYEISQKDWEAMRVRIGFAGSYTPLISFYSGWRNITFPALYHKLGSLEEVEAQANKLLAALGIDEDLELLPAYLERVTRQKLVLIRAFLLQPEVLFLDEPCKLFDALETAALQKFFLKNIRKNNMAMVIATQDIAFAIEESDTIIFVTENNVYTFASAEEILASDIPAIQRFLDSPENKVHDHEKAQ